MIPFFLSDTAASSRKSANHLNVIFSVLAIAINDYTKKLSPVKQTLKPAKVVQDRETCGLEWDIRWTEWGSSSCKCESAVNSVYDVIHKSKRELYSALMTQHWLLARNSHVVLLYTLYCSGIIWRTTVMTSEQKHGINAFLNWFLIYRKRNVCYGQ